MQPQIYELPKHSKSLKFQNNKKVNTSACVDLKEMSLHYLFETVKIVLQIIWHKRSCRLTRGS